MSETKAPKRWMGVEQLAQYLNLSPRTVYNGIAPKSKAPFPIRARRFGRHVLFDRLEVDRYLESQ